MKRIADFLFSAQLMAVIIAVFAISIAVATFIENDFGSLSARTIVYNAHWFELLLLLGTINLSGRVFVKKLFTRQKFTIFIFHIAFIIILAGAAITRYTGWEGTLSVREGQSTNKILTAGTYIQITAGSGDNTWSHRFRVSFNPMRRNKFDQSFAYQGNDFRLQSKIFIPNAFETIEPATDGYPVKGQTYDAVVTEIISGNKKKEVILMGKPGSAGKDKRINFNGVNFVISYGSVFKNIPFELKLNDFIVERYPGSQSPSSFESRVTLKDKEKNLIRTSRIYMNNILKYRGFRFYQASFDEDEKGTILSVNHDLAGTSVTYSGYFILGLGMLLSLLNRNSRFRWLSADSNRIKKLKNTPALILILILSQCFTMAQANDLPEIVPVDQDHAKAFGRMLVQDNNGRIEPINTLSSELLRKLTRNNTYKGLDADQVFLGMMVDPGTWQHEPVIRASHPEIKKLLGSDEKYHAFSVFFQDQNYILQDYIEKAFRKTPATRSKFDNEIIRLNEKVNICYLVFSGNFLRIFPVPGDSTHTWYNAETVRGQLSTIDSVFAENITLLYLQNVQKSMLSGDWKEPSEILNAISAYQSGYSADIIPPAQKVSIEVFLNKSDIFSGISKYYGLVGFALLILQLLGFFGTRFKLRVPVIVATVLIILLFCIHTAGLGLRWYVSGHAPWSNGYEALTYVAWATVLAGLIFASKSYITLSVTSILAFLILFVAHLSWMDPQITNLVPVLKSYWLVIHVATITASYGFLAMGAILAFVNLLLIIVHNRQNRVFIQHTLHELSNTIEMSQTIGLYLLTIGVFLGAVWANESWGRYWGWDPKETWALVTVLVYAFVLHMRMVTGLKGIYAFNLASLLAIGSVIMTYFGVNYYLSGLHSYAKGDPLPVPVFVYYATAIIVIAALIAYFRKEDFNSEQSVLVPRARK